MAMTTAYTLDHFLTDTRATIKTKGIPAGLAEIRDHLEKLLHNPDLLKKHLGDPVPYTERATIGHDPETDVHVLVHGRDKAGRSSVHDHGPCWVVYGNYRNPTRMPRWRRLDDGCKPGYADLALQREFLNESGHAVAFAVGDIHSIEFGDDTFFIRVTGGDVESKETLRFDPEKKTVEVANRALGDKVLRFDFMLAGNYQKTVVYPAGMKEESFFAGSRENLIDPFDYGNFKYEIFDIAENRLIYSRGFCTLFQEWQTTSEAKTIERSFYEVATMPYPNNQVRFVLSMRERNGNFTRLYETVIDPTDYYIKKEKPLHTTVTKLHGSGVSRHSLDLAFIAEGYTEAEMGKFREDVRKMADILATPGTTQLKLRLNRAYACWSSSSPMPRKASCSCPAVASSNALLAGWRVSVAWPAIMNVCRKP